MWIDHIANWSPPAVHLAARRIVLRATGGMHTRNAAEVNEVDAVIHAVNREMPTALREIKTALKDRKA